MNDKIKVTGIVQFIVKDKDGKVIEEVLGNNLVNSAGQDLIAF